MERAELVELLYSAAERSRTVRATVTRWTDERRLRELLRARSESRDPPAIPPEEGSFGEPPDRVEGTTRIWRARPDLVRWEKQHRAGGTTSREVVVNRGNQQWVNSDMGGARSSEDVPLSGMSAPEERLLDPAPLLGGASASKPSVRGASGTDRP